MGVLHSETPPQLWAPAVSVAFKKILLGSLSHLCSQLRPLPKLPRPPALSKGRRAIESQTRLWGTISNGKTCPFA